MTGIRESDVFVLDIDGTLMQTHEIDNQCYWDAVHEVFGPRDCTETLSSFTHVSDSGILKEWCRQFLGRDPLAAEITRVKDLFMELMESIADQQPELFAPQPGLEKWLENVTAHNGIHLAIATGSWGNTASFKMEFSGLARYGLAMASADDAVSRSDIMTIALERLRLDPAPESNRITYIGDGPWDLRASQELGWSFIGIAHGERARVLRDLGAERVDTDFRALARYYGNHSR